MKKFLAILILLVLNSDVLGYQRHQVPVTHQSVGIVPHQMNPDGFRNVLFGKGMMRPNPLLNPNNPDGLRNVPVPQGPGSPFAPKAK
jgi:hypothetical protein